MADFALYNYEFDISLPAADSPDIFGSPSPIEQARKNFARKQEILDKILDDDINGRRRLEFKKSLIAKPFLHDYVFEPKNGIYALRLKKSHKLGFHDSDLRPDKVDDYNARVVIIDNSLDVQLLAIELKGAKMEKLTAIEKTIENTFNAVLRKKYFLSVRLENQYSPTAFWEIVEDKRKYPRGFNRVVFKFPRRNLARIVNKRNKVALFFDKTREEFDSEVSVELKAPQGSKLDLSHDNETHRDYVDAAAATGGPESATAYPVGSRKGIRPGAHSLNKLSLSDHLFESNTTDNPDLFSQPWAEVKSGMETASTTNPDNGATIQPQ